MAIDGVFFPNHTLTAKGMGAFGNAILTDGVVAGCSMTISGTTISIGTGYIIACGRLIQIQSTETVSTDGATSGYITIEVNTANETSGNPSFNLGFSTTAPSSSGDINLSNTSYIAAIGSLSNGAVTPNTAGATVGRTTTLWSSTQSSYSSGSITLNGGSNYKLFLIVFLIDDYYDSKYYTTSIVPAGYAFDCSTGYYSFTLGKKYIYGRTVTISGSTATFGKGYWGYMSATGGSTDSPTCMVPVEILGLR